MVTIPENIIPERTSLYVPGGLPIRARENLALVRFNIRQAAEEEPGLLEQTLKFQASQDAWGRGGVYDRARPELASRRS